MKKMHCYNFDWLFASSYFSAGLKPGLASTVIRRVVAVRVTLISYLELKLNLG